MQSWLEQISQQCAHEYNRRLVVVPGPLAESWQSLQPWLSARRQDGLQIGLVTVDGIKPEQIASANITALKANRPANLLGYEHDHVIFNAFDGLYPDALAAVSGTIKAGGLLILLCPSFTQWPEYSDTFSQKRQPHGSTAPSSPLFIRQLIRSFERHNILTWPCDPITAAPAKFSKPNLSHGQLTAEQQAIHDAICDTPNHPHVITADRGRGKSYLLGRLANSLLTQHPMDHSKDNGIKLYLTGPNKKAASSVYGALDHRLQDQLHFIAPEDVASLSADDAWLLVDEAASLPIPLLMDWSKQFRHRVFATTTHGYEGTGKGFQIKFFEHLKRTHGTWQQHELTHPIRYADNDPLEHWLFDALLLDAEPNAADVTKTEPHRLVCREISQQTLANDPALLKTIFGLLINAHYQTKPSDVRDILDAPGLRIFVQEYNADANGKGSVVSACLCTDEGPIETSLWQPICQGQRRPNGHLIPQSFGFYLGLPNAMAKKCARIIRIATQPNLQRQNLASDLLNFIEHTLRAEQYDIIGSSFAGTHDVIQFWQKNGYTLIKSGTLADHASGSASALVVKALQTSSDSLLKQANDFYRFVSAQELLDYQNIPDSAKQVLHDFAFKKGSTESALQILARTHSLPLPTLPLNKKAANQFRTQVKNWLTTL